MTREVAFAVPGSLDTPTGGYAYDRQVIGELRGRGWAVEVIDLGEGFPNPTPEIRQRACRALAAIPAGRRVIVDGLAFGVLPDAARTLAQRNPLIALVHHPLAEETGLSRDEKDRLLASERLALACAREVIVTSAATGRLLASDYDVPTARVTVAVPGAPKGTPERRPDRGPVQVLAVGSVVPRKGYDVLFSALAELKSLDWRLTVVGDRTRSAMTVQQLDEQIDALGLRDRVTQRGAVSSQALAGLYANADVFALASRFEGYGMAFTEAVAFGLPIVGTTAGAIPEAVPPDAAILVAPEDPGALAAALRDVIADPSKRARLAAAARQAAESLPTWAATADRVGEVLERVR